MPNHETLLNHVIEQGYFALSVWEMQLKCFWVSKKLTCENSYVSLLKSQIVSYYQYNDIKYKIRESDKCFSVPFNGLLLIVIQYFLFSLIFKYGKTPDFITLILNKLFYIKVYGMATVELHPQSYYAFQENGVTICPLHCSWNISTAFKLLMHPQELP